MTAIIWDWIKNHWAELIALAGAGTGGIATGKKLIDKEQDKKIKALDKRLSENELLTKKLDDKIDTNTKFDKQFREEMTEFKTDTKGHFIRIEQNQNDKFNQILQILQMNK